jgi:hypothetical protein
MEISHTAATKIFFQLVLIRPMARSIFMGKSSEKLNTLSLTDNTISQRTAKH